MPRIFGALSYALRDLLRLKIFWIIIWPTFVASILWLILGMLLGDTSAEWINKGFAEIGIQRWLDNSAPQWLANGITSTIHWLILIPLIIITSLIITAIFAMPALINFVASNYYPNLERKQGGSIRGSLVNALIAIGIFSLIWVATLPLWMLGAGFIIPFAAAAYLNQKLFRYDALAEHASNKEIKTLLATDRLSLWSLGLLTGMVQFIPIINLFAPVFAALAFIHFEMASLKTNRASSPV